MYINSRWYSELTYYRATHWWQSFRVKAWKQCPLSANTLKHRCAVGQFNTLVWVRAGLKTRCCTHMCPCNYYVFVATSRSSVDIQLLQCNWHTASFRVILRCPSRHTLGLHCNHPGGVMLYWLSFACLLQKAVCQDETVGKTVRGLWNNRLLV